MATVLIPSALRAFTGNRAELKVAGATVREVLANLERAHPGISGELLDGAGALKRYVNVFHNDEDVRALQRLDTRVREADVLSIIPAMAGG